MKMRGAKQVHYDSGPNMTPLVDVVMVILIFLMLAGSFGGATNFLISKQGVHQKGAGGKVDPNAIIETPIDIHVNVAPGGFKAEGGGLKATSAEELQSKLASLRQGFIDRNQKVPEVDLYPSRNLKYQYVIQAYQAVLEAKFEKVAFATTSH